MEFISEENIKLLLKRQQIFEFIDRNWWWSVVSWRHILQSWRLYQGYIVVMLKVTYIFRTFTKCFTVIISFDDHGFSSSSRYHCIWLYRLTNKYQDDKCSSVAPVGGVEPGFNEYFLEFILSCKCMLMWKGL